MHPQIQIDPETSLHVNLRTEDGGDFGGQA